jgi:DNA-3-methyladenine glycosylase
MKLDLNFYIQDALIIAPSLIGKLLVRKLENGEIIRYRITETEAYRGEEDTACHAKIGKTERNKPLYNQGGSSYVYFCYGIHYLFNVVTGEKDNPQAVLIRGVEGYNGPAKLTKIMQIDKNINEVSLINSDKIWIEDDNFKCKYITDKRVGIDYATDYYRNIKWRFIINNKD